MEDKRDWDKVLNSALFAYRSSPLDNLGFTPFELVYAFQVRTPLDVLRDGWISKDVSQKM